MADGIVIVIESHASGFTAKVKDKPELWGIGRWHDEAVGNLVMAHASLFGIARFEAKKEYRWASGS